MLRLLILLTTQAGAGTDTISKSPVPSPNPLDLTLYTAVSTVYETNLLHTPSQLDSYGLLLGAGADVRARWSHTTLELQYDGVYRSYTDTDIWDVPGHQASIAAAQRVAKRWALGGEAGIQLNGSSEDRVLRNEYTAQADLEYRPRGASRIQLYLEYMLKRYPDALNSRNATDPRVGVRYRRLLGATGAWSIGGRYDYNQADTARHTYRGWTATTDVAVPVTATTRISASFRYTLRRYPSRLVTIDTVTRAKALRRDADHVATIAWRQGIARVWEVAGGYRFEYYRSNDPDKIFRDNMFAVTLTRYW